MRRTRSTALALTALTALASGAVAVTGPAATAAPAYTVTPLHFQVTVGPAGDRQTCDVVGDLYLPQRATPRNRMPAVLSTNGFGGSRSDQAGFSKALASRGYVALAYSGLGFGGSGCEITLDDPDYDGQAAAQLIDYLGGKAGIAFKDAAHTRPAARLDKVQLDAPGDPRVGMFGISYGGQVQYAAASVTPKLDAIVPIITWNDLSYSLGPNNTDQFALPGQEQPGVSTRTPGSVKQNWALAFSALGLTADAQNQQRPISSRCPNFADFVCPALVNGAATGTLDDASIAKLRRASVASYQDEVRIPTLILQGQADTLFNLNEAVATYRALEEQGTEVKMSWVNYGHSGAPAKGEIDFSTPNPTTQLVTRRIFNWFEHHLKDKDVDTGPEFSYFRDWVGYDGIATPAYRSASSYPVGGSTVYHLSTPPEAAVSGGALVSDRSEVAEGVQAFTTPAGPASGGEDPDVISTFFERPEQLESGTEVPGTFARYDTAPLPGSVDVVGSPEVRLQVEAPTATATQGQDAGKLVLYLKVVDVAPGPTGTATVVRSLAAPVRVPDVTQDFTVTMPAFVHRFEQGHRIRLLVAGASPNYRGNNVPTPVTIATDGDAPAGEGQPLQSITLPTVGAAAGEAYLPGPDVPPSTGGGPGPGAGGGSGGGGTGGSGGPAAPTGAGDGGAVGGDAATPKGGAQAAPVATVSSAGAAPLPDTGGPHRGLLVTGLLLVLVGALLQRARGGRRALR